MPRDSSALDPLFYAAGQKYGIDPSLIKSVSTVESGVNPGVQDSYQGAQGLMQMLPATAASMGATNPRDPSQAIDAAAKYLAEGYDKTGSAEGALAYYHGGPDQRQWGPKTRAYVSKVSGTYTGMRGSGMAKKDPHADLISEFGTMPAAPAAQAPTADAQAAAPASNDYGDLVKEFGTAPASPAPVTPQAQAGPSKAYRGSVLPFSIDEQGNTHFDSSAGVLGAIRSALTLPGDVASGQYGNMLTDQGNPLTAPGVMSRVVDMASMGTPLNAGATARMAAQGAVTPTADALRVAAKEGYNAVRDSGVTYSADAVAKLSQTMKQGLENDGVLSELAPKTHAVLNRLTDPPAGSVAPIGGLEAARRSFGLAAKDFGNPTEQLAAKRAQEGIEQFIGAADPATVVSGDAAGAANSLADARGNYGAFKRSDRITGAEDAAQLRADATNSGLNGDNAIRGRVASLLNNAKASAGFSDAERSALEEVARGTAGRNTIRYVGNLLGGGGGLGAMITGSVGGGIGAIATGAPAAMTLGAIPPAIGLASKAMGNALTSRALSRADELVRQRSPLYNMLLQQNPAQANMLLAPQALLRGQWARPDDQ